MRVSKVASIAKALAAIFKADDAEVATHVRVRYTLAMRKKMEGRVAQLERRLAVVETKATGPVPAWVKYGGWAKNDPIYDEAMKLGAQCRKRQKRKPLPDARSR